MGSRPQMKDLFVQKNRLMQIVDITCVEKSRAKATSEVIEELWLLSVLGGHQDQLLSVHRDSH
jgi:hypothetical protein